MKIRILLVSVWLAVITIGMALLSRAQDRKYRLPTPLTPGNKQVEEGFNLFLQEQIEGSDRKTECPYSKCNIAEFKYLVLTDETRYCLSHKTEYAKMAADQEFSSCHKPNRPASEFRNNGWSPPKYSI